MHVLVTGATGRLGKYVLSILTSEGHTVVASDMKDPDSSLPGGVTFHKANTTSIPEVDALYDAALAASPNGKLDGLVHLGAIPNPRPDLDDRELHNNNVVSGYNVLRTAVDRGVKRIVQTSSVNAHGLSYAPEGHTTFDKFPITEEVERRPEDAYAISKHEMEIQGDALVRWDPTVRIASLRPHMVRESYDTAWPDCRAMDIFSWVSYEATARACVLGLTSEGWSGHEVFNVVAPEICWEGSVEKQRTKEDGVGEGEKVGTQELVRKYWPKVEMDEEYWAGRPRRAVWDSSKAERMLGWKHD